MKKQNWNRGKENVMGKIGMKTAGTEKQELEYVSETGVWQEAGSTDFWEEETAVGVVEVILILVVLISLVLIFKKQLISLVKAIFAQIDSKTKSVY